VDACGQRTWYDKHFRYGESNQHNMGRDIAQEERKQANKQAFVSSVERKHCEMVIVSRFPLAHGNIGTSQDEQ
jgi:hypothetical protein